MSWYALTKGRKIIAVMPRKTDCWEIALNFEGYSPYHSVIPSRVKRLKECGYAIKPVSVTFKKDAT